MRDIIYIAIIVILSLALFTHRDTPPPEQVVRVDTTISYTPLPALSQKLSSQIVKLPRVLFVERRDTVTERVVDTVSVEVDIEKRIYRDSLYELTISGARVGDYRPTLDEIRVYSCSTTRTIQRWPDRWWEIGATVGATYCREGEMWGGLEVRRHSGRLSYGGVVGYATSGSPFIEVHASLTLFRSRLNR